MGIRLQLQYRAVYVCPGHRQRVPAQLVGIDGVPGIPKRSLSRMEPGIQPGPARWIPNGLARLDKKPLSASCQRRESRCGGSRCGRLGFDPDLGKFLESLQQRLHRWKRQRVSSPIGRLLAIPPKRTMGEQPTGGRVLVNPTRDRRRSHSSTGHSSVNDPHPTGVRGQCPPTNPAYRAQWVLAQP